MKTTVVGKVMITSEGSDMPGIETILEVIMIAIGIAGILVIFYLVLSDPIIPKWRP